ncbi:hypothetical protein ABCR94_12405 [Streptomyces sp. 21So2-11]|uniref:hypothetical protein n=1 Tax=Streptomyces sp. 21So2-11 TaxID=3144408 RepID=UPI00321B4F0C
MAGHRLPEHPIRRSLNLLINAGGGLLGFSAYSAWLVTESVWWTLLWAMPIPALISALATIVILSVKQHRAGPHPAKR